MYDNGKPLVFVGRSFHNKALYKYFSSKRNCYQLSIEEVMDKPDDWINKHQFFCAVSIIEFKVLVQNQLAARNAHLFSVVSSNSEIGADVKIGRSTLINHFNTLYDDAIVGDFVTVSNYIQLGHNVIVNDACHVAPYCYASFSTIGKGNYLGLRGSFHGYPDTPIVTAEYTNFNADSRVSKSVELSGTYYGNRLTDKRNSLELVF